MMRKSGRLLDNHQCLPTQLPAAWRQNDTLQRAESLNRNLFSSSIRVNWWLNIPVKLTVAVVVYPKPPAIAHGHASEGKFRAGTRRLQQRLPRHARVICSVGLKHASADVDESAM